MLRVRAGVRRWLATRLYLVRPTAGRRVQHAQAAVTLARRSGDSATLGRSLAVLCRTLLRAGRRRRRSRPVTRRLTCWVGATARPWPSSSGRRIALWYGWEHAAVQTLGMLDWLPRLYHLLPILAGDDGPFRLCSPASGDLPARHHMPPAADIIAAPLGWWHWWRTDTTDTPD